MYAPYYLIVYLFDDAGITYRAINWGLSIIYPVIGTLNTIFAFRVYSFAETRTAERLGENLDL